MNISYISGIRGHKHSHKHSHKHIHHHHRMGNTCSPAMGAIGSVGSVGSIGSMGIGRTWADWARAVGVYNSFSFGMVVEIWTKNATLGPVRFIFEEMISKNAGGIANFLFNLSPMNEGQYNMTNLQLLETGRDLLIKKLNEKYPLANSSQSTLSEAKLQTVTDPKTGKTYQVFVAPDTNTPEKYKQGQAWEKELNAGVVELYKKYPFIVKGSSTPASQAKYRELELWWVKNVGGNPDDLNNAVKEGNSKTPVGKIFNYMLAKYANKQSVGVGLLIRGLADALALGKKFQLGDKDAFNITFYGVQQGANVSDADMDRYLKSIGIKGTGIGVDPVTDTVVAEKATEITIAGYSISAWCTALGAVLALYAANKNLFGDKTGTLTDQQLLDLQNAQGGGSGGGSGGGDSSSNMGTYLIIGGGALAAYFLMKK